MKQKIEWWKLNVKTCSQIYCTVGAERYWGMGGRGWISILSHTAPTAPPENKIHLKPMKSIYKRLLESIFDMVTMHSLKKLKLRSYLPFIELCFFDSCKVVTEKALWDS